ncbi:MAG: 7-cyano-7-deazaguanine synthase QueC [Elusimicrobiales bacterium]
MKKAIVLLSGGLDSATCLYWTKAKGYSCHALCILYGQRHGREAKSAAKIARLAGVPLTTLRLKLPWLKTSALVDKSRKLPDIPLDKIGHEGIAPTYVPGRNLLFVSLAASFADAAGARAVVLGPNALDYSGYPDCRPQFYKALAKAVARGTALGGKMKILTPIINLDKAQIAKLAARLKVPVRHTWSCYKGGAKPCGHCDACKLRAKGFALAGLRDEAL